jgi:4-hydroxybenzoate polyprenyltransferase
MDRAHCLRGLAFNWGALLGWSAVSGAVDWVICLPLYAGGVAWTLVYDTIYAHQVRKGCSTSALHLMNYSQDKDDDVKVGIRSTALLFGERTVPILSGLSAASLGLISYAGYLNHQGLPFYCGVGLAALHLAKIIRTTDYFDRASCWKGFVDCGWVGCWIWAGATVDYLWILFTSTT